MPSRYRCQWSSGCFVAHSAQATLSEQLGAKRVRTGLVSRAPASLDLTLPGTVAPFQRTSVYARGSGFVKALPVDLGSKVKAGQVLAELEAPELDEQLRLAAAKLEEVDINSKLIEARASRAKHLLAEKLMSPQDADDEQQKANSALAAVKIARADLECLQALKSFQKVRAPFDGVITRRAVDQGALVSAGATLLFDVAQVDKLRVAVDIPQAAASQVVEGTPAQLFDPNTPTDLTQAKVARTAGALDPQARTLRVELDAPQGKLAPGAFVQVRFQVKLASAPLPIPANALIVRREGTLVAKLDAQQRVQLAQIAVGRDLGKELEVLSGASAGETLVLNPPDDLTDGMTVQATNPSAEKPSAKP